MLLLLQVVVVLEKRIIQSSFDTFVRLPMATARQYWVRAQNILCWHAVQRKSWKKRTKSIVRSVTNMFSVPRCAANQEAETETATASRRGEERRGATHHCRYWLRLWYKDKQLNNNSLLQTTDSLRAVRWAKTLREETEKLGILYIEMLYFGLSDEWSLRKFRQSNVLLWAV